LRGRRGFIAVATSVPGVHRNVAKVYEPEASLLAQIVQADTAGLWTMRHRISYGKDAISGKDAIFSENVADSASNGNFAPRH
jgi:hypothetical protein